MTFSEDAELENECSGEEVDGSASLPRSLPQTYTSVIFGTYFFDNSYSYLFHLSNFSKVKIFTVGS